MVERVRVDVAGPVKTVTLTRPEKRNAMDTAMLDALYEVFTEAPAPTDRLIVLRAEGSTYCSGVDLKERLALGVTSGESPVERVFHAMETHPLPIVTVVEGPAIAGGCELALHCEFIVASEDARFRHVFGAGGIGADLVPREETHGSGGARRHAGNSAAWRSDACAMDA